MKITLYFNDPPGRRWTNIHSVVAELSEKYPLNIKIIKKSEMPFIDRRLVNEFPAVAISDNIVFKGRDVSIDEFKAVIIEHTGKTEHLP